MLGGSLGLGGIAGMVFEVTNKNIASIFIGVSLCTNDPNIR